jgi:hypothetical protein
VAPLQPSADALADERLSRRAPRLADVISRRIRRYSTSSLTLQHLVPDATAPRPWRYSTSSLTLQHLVPDATSSSEEASAHMRGTTPTHAPTHPHMAPTPTHCADTPAHGTDTPTAPTHPRIAPTHPHMGHGFGKRNLHESRVSKESHRNRYQRQESEHNHSEISIQS